MLQPVGGLPIGRGGGICAASLGTAAHSAASRRDAAKQSADTGAAKNPGAGGEGQSPGAREGHFKKFMVYPLAQGFRLTRMTTPEGYAAIGLVPHERLV